MNERLPAGIDAWVTALSDAEMPILSRTLREIGSLREDEVTPREISAVVLRDPLLTLRVLRFIEARRKPEQQPTEITTIEHALMMLGAVPFFRSCRGLTSVADRLKGNATAIAGYRKVLSRASHAVVYAKSWAAYRSDAESDEVLIATLLHGLAEMLLWCFYPQAAIDIETLQANAFGLRSADAQQRVLGFKLQELQLALCTAWRLPQLLRDLMDENHAQAPRVKNVVLAVALARHSANGWHDAALPDDYKNIAAFLKLTDHEARERVVRLAFAAAARNEWYGLPGTAAQLPQFIALDDPDAPRGIAIALQRAQEKLLGILLDLLPALHASARGDHATLSAIRALVNATVHYLHTELGLPRAMFAAVANSTDGARITAVAIAGPDSASLKRFGLTGDERNIFARLIQSGNSIWVSPANREAMSALLSQALTDQIGHGDFVATAVRPVPEYSVLGILFGDRGRDSGGLDLATATACNYMARFLGACIGMLHKSTAHACEHDGQALPAY